MMTPRFTNTKKFILLTSSIVFVSILLICSLLFVLPTDDRPLEGAAATYTNDKLTVTYDNDCFTVSSAEASISGGAWDQTITISIIISPKTGYIWTSSSVEATYITTWSGIQDSPKSISLSRSGNTWSGSGDISMGRSLKSATATFGSSKVSPINYTVAYNGNGNTGGSTASSTHTYGSSKALTANGFTKTGYTFVGWATSSTGSVIYSNGQSVRNLTTTNNGTVNLYARWQATVNLDQQEGSGGSGSVTVIYDSAMPTATAPTRTGWEFAGYYTAIGGAGTQYYTKDMTSAKNWTEATGITLYAKWTTQVTLSKAGGTGGSDYVVITYNAPMPTATAPTRPGYSFGGYYTESNGNGTRFYTENMTGAQNWNLTLGVTLYAKWIAGIYTITFNYNGATGGADLTSKNVSYGSLYGDLPQPVKSGSTFGGWYLESTFDTLITNTTVVNVMSNHTLYARWTSWLILHVAGTSNSVNYSSQINDANTTASIDIYPGAGQYVSTISFDNVNFYSISYTDYTFSDLDFALRLSYCASNKNNYMGVDIEHIYPNYFTTTGSIHIYLIMMSTPYDRLTTASGGASVAGVAVGATLGGIAYVVGDDYDNLADSDTITLIAKVTMPNYRFVGWYLADNMASCLSTEESVAFAKFVVYERQVIAKFAPITNNINTDTDNQ